MDIDFKGKRVKLSAREFACFDFSFENKTKASPSVWAMFLGAQWHRTIQKESEESGKLALKEISLSADLNFAGWIFSISGNADEVFEESYGYLVREIKTTRREFPIEEIDFMHRVQLAFYVYALGKKSHAEGELLYVNTNTGERQTLKLLGEPLKILNLRAEKFVEYLKEREDASVVIENLDLSLPFDTLRDGQAEALELLQKVDNERVVSFNAPTAFGKTAISLFVALAKLQKGEVDNIICLSSKSSGQLQFIRELRKFLRNSVYPKSFQFRNRNEHIIHDLNSRCVDCIDCKMHNFGDFVFSFKKYFTSSFVSLDKIKSDSEEFGLCPYNLSLAMLAYTQLWICDYNYIFSPSVRSVFENEEVFNPKKTLLIIDEAHNLENRVEIANSGKISLEDLLLLKSALVFEAPSLRISVTSIIETLENSQGELSLEEIELLSGDLIRIAKNSHKLNLDELLSYAKNILFNVIFLAKCCMRDSVKLFYTYNNGVLYIDCYDASVEVAQTLKKFKHSLLLSASEVDLPKVDITEHKFKPTWLTNCFNHVFDISANTSANYRFSHLANTVESIYLAKKYSNSPLVVFFPSYAYAKKAMDLFSQKHKEFSNCIQAKNLSYAKQIEFLEVALLGSDIICLIMASSFAESIDILGGRVGTAMIVSIALPEINDILNAKMQMLIDAKSMPRQVAFNEVYAKRGYSKIKQAVGRLVRSPEHKATIIYHCERYLKAPFNEYFKEEIASNNISKTPRELEELLQKLKKNGFTEC